MLRIESAYACIAVTPATAPAAPPAVPDKVVAAYKRTEFLEMRRKLLDGWGAFLAGESNVVHLATEGKAA